jgi:hypothetical protein
MSDTQSRPARGRSTARGGRGSFTSRGPRKPANGDGAPSIDTSAEAGELAELKKRYQPQLTTLKELFPDWTDADLVLAIEDSDGDLERTIEKISEGECLYEYGSFPSPPSSTQRKCMHRALLILPPRLRLSVCRSTQESQGPLPLKGGEGECRAHRRCIQCARRSRRGPPTRH